MAEHGGFSEDDTHVALLVFNGSSDREGDAMGESRTASTPVGTRQIAPTILRFLRLNPQLLQSVRAEDAPPLPVPEN